MTAINLTRKGLNASETKTSMQLSQSFETTHESFFPEFSKNITITYNTKALVNNLLLSRLYKSFTENSKEEALRPLQISTKLGILGRADIRWFCFPPCFDNSS